MSIQFSQGKLLGETRRNVGIWMTIVEQDETIKPDKRKRARNIRKGKRVVVLVALGWDIDGRREILDWEIASSEGHKEWEGLLNRLKERGVGPETGLKMVVRDGGGGLKKAIELFYGASGDWPALYLSQVTECLKGVSQRDQGRSK